MRIAKTTIYLSVQKRLFLFHRRRKYGSARYINAGWNSIARVIGEFPRHAGRSSCGIRDRPLSHSVVFPIKARRKEYALRYFLADRRPRNLRGRVSARVRDEIQLKLNNSRRDVNAFSAYARPVVWRVTRVSGDTRWCAPSPEHVPISLPLFSNVRNARTLVDNKRNIVERVAAEVVAM